MTAHEKEGLHLPIKVLEELQAPKWAIHSSFESHSVAGWSRTWDSLALASSLLDHMPPLDYFLKLALVFWSCSALNYQQTGCVFMCSLSTFFHTTEVGGWVSSCRSRSAHPRQTFITALQLSAFDLSRCFQTHYLTWLKWHWITVLFEQTKKKKEYWARLFFNLFCF